MAGAGARLTIHSGTINIGVCAEPAPGTQPADYCHALKKAALTASVLLASATKGLRGDDIEVFDLERPRDRLDGLPRVAYLMQLHSHGEIREPFVYGAHTRSYYPTILHPNEILDGAVVCGHYNISPAIKNTTYTLLNHPVIRGLFGRHGTELDFRGVVIAPEPTSLTEIARTSMLASGLLKNALQADGVVITKEGGGHTDVDLMGNCDACERLGIKTVLIDNEWLGPDGAGEFPLLASSPNADAMVSVGNADAVVRLPPMERVIGGNKLMGGFSQDLEGEITLPVWFIPNAVSQAGFTYLSTVAHVPWGSKENIITDTLASERAIRLLLKKMNGEPVASEITFTELDLVAPAPPITNLKEATIALITEGGLVPGDNPDAIPSSRATKYGKYRVAALLEQGCKKFISIHRGFDTTFVNEDCNRLLPVDVLADMEKEGVFKRIYPFFFSTTGVATTIENAHRIGRGIASELVAEGVTGALVAAT